MILGLSGASVNRSNGIGLVTRFFSRHPRSTCLQMPIQRGAEATAQREL
jgi:hypothetical protein